MSVKAVYIGRILVSRIGLCFVMYDYVEIESKNLDNR